jgi:penicillin-binding protein 2
MLGMAGWSLDMTGEVKPFVSKFLIAYRGYLCKIARILMVMRQQIRVFPPTLRALIGPAAVFVVVAMGMGSALAQTAPAAPVVAAVSFDGDKATDTRVAVAIAKDVGVVPKPKNGEGLGGSLTVRPDARTMILSIPAPRGQITDRNGEPFAQSKVVWYPALKYVQFEKADRAYVIEWARKRIALANEVFGINWRVTDEALWQHYRHRRWLAMPTTHVVDADRKTELEGQLMDGLILHPVYMRHYPQGECAAHIIGYVGSAGKLEKGPINYGDPIFERSEGRAGLEKIFDESLTGKEGMLRQDFEADGSLVFRKYENRARPGGTIVTSLDLNWQKEAEKVLENYCERGAFVVIDIHTGEVLTMASRPSFNLNDFIPFISTDKYAALRDDPATPLFARAYQGGYPPASTFKPVIAVTALSNRDVYEHTLINCPAQIKIGNHWFRNWSKTPEGAIDVKRALARSCNPWFYQVGIKTGPSAFLSVARRLGFGSKTGLPLVGETEGLIPNNKWMKKHHGRRLLDGDTANLSIGQGVMLASPLQVAQGMAGIANGGALPKLRLVKQVQDVAGRVLVTNDPERRNFLNLDPMAVKIVHEGMMQVVNAGYGTGMRGKLSYTILCGKTGTAQWGPKSKEQRLAWFAGFFPLENPRYAFAALYEGKPHEKLSGGRKAAPIVSTFFEHFGKDIKKAITPPPKAVVIEEDEDEGVGYVLDNGNVPRAIPVEEDDEEGLVPYGDDARPLRAIPVEEDTDEFSGAQKSPVKAILVEE